jgi:threonine/homoserine/homoserine lactone efflux protein
VTGVVIVAAVVGLLYLAYLAYELWKQDGWDE